MLRHTVLTASQGAQDEPRPDARIASLAASRVDQGHHQNALTADRNSSMARADENRRHIQSHPAESPRQTSITPLGDEDTRAEVRQHTTTGLPIAEQFALAGGAGGFNRDADASSGLAASSTGQDGGAHSDAGRAAVADVSSRSPTHAKYQYSAAGADPRIDAGAALRDHRHGRDATVGAGAAGAGGAAAYEADRHHAAQQQPPAAYGSAAPTLATTIAARQPHQALPREQEHHYPRDAAVGGGAAAAAYGINEEEQKRQEKQHAKAQKQHEKEVRKEEKEYEKEVKKEQKHAEKEQKKAEKEHEKEVAAVEKAQKQRE